MKKLTSKQTRLFQAKMFARPLNFPQHIVDCGEVTSGPIRRVPPGAILSLLVVPNHTWKALACAIQWRVVPSTDWCLRKPSFSSACICAPRPVSTWVETAKIVLDILCAPATDDAYNHTTYISTNATSQRVLCSRVWSKQVNGQKESSNHQLPYKGSSRGGTLQLLLSPNKVEIPIPDWS